MAFSPLTATLHAPDAPAPAPVAERPAARAPKTPFRLARYIGVTSLLGLLVVLGALLACYRYTAFEAIREHEARNNVALTQVFANTLWPRHADYIGHAVAAYGRAGLAERPETARLREDVLQQMSGLNVVKVKIYDLAGTTVFSTDPKQIGRDASRNSGFLTAKAGGVASEITFRNHFDAFEGAINDRNLVSSYIPVRRGEGSRVEAVMEVYSDVTEFVADLERTQWQIGASLLGTLSLLYMFLFMIVRRADAIIRSQQQEMEAAHRAMLLHQASHDALTELPNRTSFAERLDSTLKNARRTRGKVAVLCIDVHGFKTVNESLGHLTGDRLVKAVAGRLQRCLRESDVTARRGGAEFAVAIPHARGIDHVATIAEKVKRALAGSTYAIDDHDVAVTVSIGIAMHPEDGEDASTLIRAADAAMHHAQGLGRNACQFHTAGMNAHALKVLVLEEDLRRALARDELLLHYQPQLDLATGEIVGAEALIRWNHPQRGLVSPAEFIPLAEERELIVPIGNWVLREACRQNRAWQDAGMRPMPVSVNLSALQLQQKDLPQQVESALRTSGLDPRYLELELTESAVMRDAERSIETMHALRRIGVRLSLDDFGTGYSGLSRLKRLPLDTLKIDQSFVRGLPDDPYDVALCTAIIGMGKALDLTVIAEGVETAQQLDTLRAIDCCAIQGFYLSRPLPATDYARFAMDQAKLAA